MADSETSTKVEQSPSRPAGEEDSTSAKTASPPDGGTVAWLAALASFLLFFMTWGPTIAFGLFQNYYQSHLLSTHTPSQISWIGTINTFLLIVVGVVAGPLFDQGYLRHLMTLGCVLSVVGIFMLSLAKSYYQIMLAQGICFGLGCGLIYVPSLAFISYNFTTRRALAMGFVTSGASIGGMLFPIIFLQLEPRIGYAWTVRVFGFVMLACACVGLPLLYRAPAPQPSATPRALLDRKALRDPVFLAAGAAQFLTFLAYFIPFFYGPAFATTRLNLPLDTAFYQLAAINAGSTVARLATPFLAPRFGSPLLLLGGVVASTVLAFAWMGVSSAAGWWAWAVVFGVFSGSLISANPVVMAHRVLAPDRAWLGTRLGMLWFIMGLGTLIGAPVAGALLGDVGEGGEGAATGVGARNAFWKLQGFTAAIMVAGLGCFLVPTVAIWRDERRQRKVEGESG